MLEDVPVELFALPFDAGLLDEIGLGVYPVFVLPPDLGSIELVVGVSG